MHRADSPSHPIAPAFTTLRLLVPLLVLSVGSIRLEAQPFYALGFYNLDAEAGPLTANARFPNGEQINTTNTKFGEASSGTALTDAGPTKTWILDSAGGTYSEGFFLYAGITQVVAYGGGSTFTYPGGRPDVLINTMAQDLPLTLHGMNGPTATTTARRTEAHTLGERWMYDYYTGIRVGFGTWWVLTSSDIPFITTASDTLLVGQIFRAWGIRTDTEVDSGEFRLVNLTDRGDLSLEVESSGSLSCGELSTSGVLAAGLGNQPKWLRVIVGGNVVLDTTVVPYPYMLTDIIVAPDGAGGITFRLVERLRSRIGRSINRYWDGASQVIFFPGGALSGTTIQVFDTAGGLRELIEGLDNPAYRGLNLPRKQFVYRDVQVIGLDDQIAARFDMQGEGRDSVTYIMVDRGAGIELYSYDEFDEAPQDLRLENLELDPSGIPWEIGVASFCALYDSLEVVVSTLDEPIGVASGWYGAGYGPVVGDDLRYDVLEAPSSSISGGGPGDVVASGVLSGSPGSFSILLLDDAPGGGVRTISYDILPGTSRQIIRLVNFTEGIGAIGLTPEGKPTEWTVPPVVEGALGVENGDLKTNVSYTIRTSSGDSIGSRVVREGGGDNTFVLDGGTEEGIVRLSMFNETQPAYPYEKKPQATFRLSTGSVVEGSGTQVLNLVPNPVHGEATLILGDGSEAESVIVVDPLGRTVRQFGVERGRQRMELSLGDIPAGIYTIIVRRREKIVGCQSLIVR